MNTASRSASLSPASISRLHVARPASNCTTTSLCFTNTPAPARPGATLGKPVPVSVTVVVMKSLLLIPTGLIREKQHD